MQEAQVTVNDFYSILATHLELARGDQFHWKTEARVLQGHAVSAAITEQLPKK